MECQIKTMFNKAWDTIVSRKSSGNNASLNYEEYQDLIRKVKWLKEETLRRGIEMMSQKNYRCLRRYDVIIREGREWLAKPSLQEGLLPGPLLLYVSNDEIFDVLHKAHQETNYGNVQLMYSRIRTKYCNVTKEAVITYLRLYARYGKPRQMVEMTATSPMAKQRLLLMPPLSQSRVNDAFVYFGFVDMHRYARDGYSSIMVHWDFGRRFINIVPLKSMENVHVAAALSEIYAKVGPPYYIDAPYAKPYITSVVDHIVWRGENCRIMTRSSDDQDVIINGWTMVQKLMEPWVDNADWLSKLNYIQRMKNYEWRTFSDSAISPSIISRSDFNPLETASTEADEDH